MSPLTRREVLRGIGLAGAAAGAAGCAARHTTATALPAATRSPTPRPTSRGPTSPQPTSSAGAATGPADGGSAGPAGLPAPRPWTAGPGEVSPAVKALATGALESVGTWAQGQGGAQAADGRLAGLGVDPGLVASLSALLPAADAAVTQVVDAQYGGILASSASVLVVVRQWFLTQGGTRHEHGTTFDVRLVRSGGRWRVTGIHPADPGPAAARPSAAAEAVLADPRIRLPAACEADIRSGQVHDSVLSALTALSKRRVLDVSILRSGHPYLVFGTDRQSDHPHGRAADVWAIDDRAVVDPANRRAVTAFMREASATGAWQVGGPVDLDGAGRSFFSDDTHQDHVHLGFHT
jgi:hypothetical protein